MVFGRRGGIGLRSAAVQPSLILIDLRRSRVGFLRDKYDKWWNLLIYGCGAAFDLAVVSSSWRSVKRAYWTETALPKVVFSYGGGGGY
jgi:hypothetical protein